MSTLQFAMDFRINSVHDCSRWRIPLSSVLRSKATRLKGSRLALRVGSVGSLRTPIDIKNWHSLLAQDRIEIFGEY